MLFSKKFMFLIIFGVFLIYGASFFGLSSIVFILYNFVLISLFILDIIVSPKKGDLNVERICDEKFSHSVKNKVGINIRNNSECKLNLYVIDKIPDYFEYENNLLRINVLPHKEAEENYYIIPKKRGEYKFGKIQVKFTGLLGFCTRQYIYDTDKNYKVYPNMRDLTSIDIKTLKKVNIMDGTKRIKRINTGSEFESLSEYISGDDYRKINWKATARINKLIVNNYEPERNQHIYILLDTTRGMNKEINFIKKLDYSINAILLLVDFLIKKGDNSSLLVFDDDIRKFINMGKGMGHFQLIADNLYNVHEKIVYANYKKAFSFLNRRINKKGLVCLFTELNDKEMVEEVSKEMKLYFLNHYRLIISIKDQKLLDLTKIKTKNSKDVFDKAAAIKILEGREKVKSIISRNGNISLDVLPDKLSIDLLNKYLQIKTYL